MNNTSSIREDIVAEMQRKAIIKEFCKNNKIVHLTNGTCGAFQVIMDEHIRLYKCDISGDLKLLKFTNFVQNYYRDNFGIEFLEWGGVFKMATIIDESKFSLFMFKHPELIEKIVYE